MKLLKLLLSITLIYILPALAFGIETAFIALICVIASIVLPLAIGVRRSATSVRDSFYSVYPNEHYYWTPGQPAISQKAFAQGFFD